MSEHNRILCPVDLSENSYAAIDLATTVAKQNDAKVAFYYVTPIWLPENALLGGSYMDQIVEDDKSHLYRLRPTDPSVGFEHHYVHGNPGPTVVQATKTADIVVMSTHGRSGVVRFLLGSVAHYVLRHAHCPVIVIKGAGVKKDESTASTLNEESKTYITDLMHQVAPIHEFDGMEAVLNCLDEANETAAPVTDGSGSCIGILTTTDIANFHSMKKRFEENDETVLDEMFEVDKYGQRRPANTDFDQVRRHMTKNVVSLRNTDTVQKAIELFQAHPEIHHLVVLDEDNRPVGIVDILSVPGIQVDENEKAAS